MFTQEGVDAAATELRHAAGMALILTPIGLLVPVPAGGSPEEIFEHTFAALIGGERQPFSQRFQRVQPAEKPACAHDCPPKSAPMTLTQVLRWAYWWNSTEDLPDHVTNESVVMELNTDFAMTGMTAQELTAVVKAWQSGAISRDSMLHLFRKGEILPEGRTTEEEEQLIGKDQPIAAAAARK